MPLPNPDAIPWHSLCPLFLALFAFQKAPNEARVMASRPGRKPIPKLEYFTGLNFLPIQTNHSPTPLGCHIEYQEEVKKGG